MLHLMARNARFRADCKMGNEMGAWLGQIGQAAAYFNQKTLRRDREKLLNLCPAP
jgi:hypothetical protein